MSYDFDDDAADNRRLRDDVSKLYDLFHDLDTQLPQEQTELPIPVGKYGRNQFGIGGPGGSTSFPLRYPLSAHGTIGLVTEIFSWNFHGHTATLTGDISVAFSNLPGAGFGEDIKLHFFHDGLAGNRIITFPTAVKNLTTVTISAGQDAIIVLSTDDGGATYDVSEQTGTGASGASNLSQLGIDVNKSWNNKKINDLDGINFNETGQGINPDPLGVVHTVDANQYFQQFIGLTKVRETAETTPGNYVDSILAILNVNDNPINHVKQIAFSGNENLGSAESGIGMDNSGARMKYKTALTNQTHDFLAVNELLASISRVGSNQGQLSIHAIVSDILQVDDQLFFTDSAADPTLNGEVRRNANKIKARLNGVTEEFATYLPDLAPLTGDLIVKKASGEFEELLKGSDGKVLTTNSLAANGLGLEWQTVAAADNLGNHQMSQTLEASGNLIDNVLAMISNAVNPASTGAIRLGNGESILWRSGDNTFNVGMSVDSSNRIQVTDPFIPNASTIPLGVSSRRWGTAWLTVADILDSLTVGGMVLMNSDVFIGTDTTDELSVSAKIISDLKMDDGKVIKPSGLPIGLFVKNIGNIGTFGSISIPFDPNFESTASAADISYGNSLGSLGVYGRGGNQEALLVVKTKTSPSTWRGVLLNDITLT